VAICFLLKFFVVLFKCCGAGFFSKFYFGWWCKNQLLENVWIWNFLFLQFYLLKSLVSLNSSYYDFSIYSSSVSMFNFSFFPSMRFKLFWIFYLYFLNSSKISFYNLTGVLDNLGVLILLPLSSEDTIYSYRLRDKIFCSFKFFFIFFFLPLIGFIVHGNCPDILG
jgi:hypothetical protein